MREDAVKIEFDKIENVADYVTVPAGTYLCKIAEVQTGTTRNGDERWAFPLIVAEGEFVGRQAAWDSVVFSPRGLARMRQVFSALGLSTAGTVEVQPTDLVGMSAFVEIRPAKYTRPGSSQVVRRNEVPYEGYTKIPDEGPGSEPEGPVEMPF